MDRDTFIARMDKSSMPFEADSYQELFETVEEFYKLFTEAKHGGIHFINIFLHTMKYKMGTLINNAVSKALDNQRDNLTQLAERQFKTGDDEFDSFRLMCLQHDWYYSYSDDGGVWRRGNDRQKKLEAIVAEKGGKYKDYWDNYALKVLGK